MRTSRKSRRKSKYRHQMIRFEWQKGSGKSKRGLETNPESYRCGEALGTSSLDSGRDKERPYEDQALVKAIHRDEGPQFVPGSFKGGVVRAL